MVVNDTCVGHFSVVNSMNIINIELFLAEGGPLLRILPFQRNCVYLTLGLRHSKDLEDGAKEVLGKQMRRRK